MSHLTFPTLISSCGKWGGGPGKSVGREQAFTEEETQMAKKCMERCLTSLTIKEMQMKTTVRTSQVLFAKQSSTSEMA